MKAHSMFELDEQGKPLDGYMLGRFEKHFERTRLQHKEDL